MSKCPSSIYALIEQMTGAETTGCFGGLKWTQMEKKWIQTFVAWKLASLCDVTVSCRDPEFVCIYE